MQLGWIDFSKEDRAKVLDVMNLLQEQGAIDEIGIGVVRDAFANYFFPGTSTIQTRAKYFLIVPYILHDAADGRYGTNVSHILEKVDKDEKQCALTLMEKSPDADGIIGKRVLPKSWISRKPSEIYWNGIRTFEIFRDKSLSIEEYFSVVMQLRKRKSAMKSGNRGDDAEDSERDDKDAGDFTTFQFWELPDYTDNWKEELDIELIEKEAVFLKRQIVRNTEGSLFSYLLKNHIPVDVYDSFETLAKGLENEVPDELRNMMDLACNFNHLVYMARVRYNVILSEGKNSEAISEWEWLNDNLPYIANVNLEEIFEKFQIYNSKTYQFLKGLQSDFQSGKIDAADDRIRNREIYLKGINRAKLNKAGEFDPDVWIGGGWLDYRFSNAKRIINDIYHGEEASHV